VFLIENTMLKKYKLLIILTLTIIVNLAIISNIYSYNDVVIDIGPKFGYMYVAISESDPPKYEEGEFSDYRNLRKWVPIYGIAFYISTETLQEFATIELEILFTNKVKIARKSTRLAKYKYFHSTTANDETLLDEDFTLRDMNYFIIPGTVKINLPYGAYLNIGFGATILVDTKIEGSIYSYIDKTIDTKETRDKYDPEPSWYDYYERYDLHLEYGVGWLYKIWDHFEATIEFRGTQGFMNMERDANRVTFLNYYWFAVSITY